MSSTVAKREPPMNREAKRPRLQPWSRALFLVAALLALSPIFGGTAAPSYVAALSPYVAVASMIAAHTIHGLAGLGLLVGLATLVRRRLFCQWICPTGLCLDGASLLGRRCRRRSAQPGALGQWLLWLTLGGACVGYPLFLWLDPLAIFSSAFSIPRPAANPARWVAGGVIGALLLAHFWRPGIWCVQACPLGAFQDSLYRLPRAVARWFRSRKQSETILESGPRLKRRAWLEATGGAAAAVVLPRMAWGARQALRPPGALSEPMFSGVCVRCGNCLRACPATIIHNAGTESGLIGWLTPILRFDADYCRENCVRCTDVCPSGALQSVKLAEKTQVRLGQPKVNLDLCFLADDRECSACRNRCPYGAITYVFSEKDYLLLPKVNLDRCNGCGACETYCPTSPVKAITVEPVTA